MEESIADEISREIERDCLRYPRNLSLKEEGDGPDPDGV